MDVVSTEPKTGGPGNPGSHQDQKPENAQELDEPRPMGLAAYYGQNVGIGQDRGARTAKGRNGTRTGEAGPGTVGRSFGAGPVGRGVA